MDRAGSERATAVPSVQRRVQRRKSPIRRGFPRIGVARDARRLVQPALHRSRSRRKLRDAFFPTALNVSRDFVN
jgi:hypothetical protein